MAAEIQDQFGVEPEMIRGSGGVFDVKVDGKLIYSKHETGRFPEHQEVLQQIESMRS